MKTLICSLTNWLKRISCTYKWLRPCPLLWENKQKCCQSKLLTAFFTSSNFDLLSIPILSINRLVSTNLSCEIIAAAGLPSTYPRAIWYLFSLVDVVRGITRQTDRLKPRNTTTGRSYNVPVPSCSNPTFAPSEHHQISLLEYSLPGASLIFFFCLNQASKSFITYSSYHRR